jgi:hypothetical protein
MHVRALGMKTCQGTPLVLALALACGGKSSTATPAVPVITESGAQSAPRATEADYDVCEDRQYCIVGGQQGIDGAPGSTLLTAVISPPAAPTSDEQCERREYWLVSTTQKTLLLADCKLQYGADSQGPADVHLSGRRLAVRYTEFQENDRCELVDATIDLVSVELERHERQVGSVAQDRCVPDGPQEPVPPVGNGSVGQPLLVLHRG